MFGFFLEPCFSLLSLLLESNLHLQVNSERTDERTVNGLAKIIGQLIVLKGVGTDDAALSTTLVEEVGHAKRERHLLCCLIVGTSKCLPT